MRTVYVTYRRQEYRCTTCEHEAGALTEGCMSCAPSWGWVVVNDATGKRPASKTYVKVAELADAKLKKDNAEAKHVLLGVKEILKTEDWWTQKAFARNRNGDNVDSSDPEAVCFCFVGAMARAGAPSTGATGIVFHEVTGKGALEFNDTHTYAELMAAIDKTLAEVSK